MNSTSNPTISVIVPVYKAEKYIHRCLDSIINQTFKDFELILVDDGSPDRSGEICDEYAAKDKRVKAIHKENGGVASARQCGIDVATGEYTIHADPDDWMELDMLECMYKAIKEEDADLLITDFYENNANEEVYNKQPIISLKQEDILKGILTNLHGSMCNKLLKTITYKENDINFIKGINIYEDNIFWIQVLLIKDLKISYLQKALYHYDLHSNDNSLTRKLNKNTSNSCIKYIYFLDTLLPQEYLKYTSYSIMEALYVVFIFNDNINNYRGLFRKYKISVKKLSCSNINKLFFYLSSLNREIAFILYNIKVKIHLFIKRIISF